MNPGLWVQCESSAEIRVRSRLMAPNPIRPWSPGGEGGEGGEREEREERGRRGKRGAMEGGDG